MTWYEILFLKYLKGLPSKARMFLKLAKGGTMQLLPENDDEPETSPFLGVIRYPDTSSDVEENFTYKQSSYTGQARIKSIKGNTLIWNQLTTFTPRSGAEDGITFEFKADGTMVFNGTTTDNYYHNVGNTYNFQGHKLYIKGCPSGGSNSTYYLRDGYNSVASERDFGNGVIVTARANTILQIQILQGVTVNNLTFTPQLFDLTAMGLDTLTDDEVKQWFSSNYPLPYYQYDSGSLLNFNGTGIKTENKDQTDEYTLSLPISTYFPTGMKSAGSVFDELSDKAITRVGSVDLGSLTWYYNTSSSRFIATEQLADAKKVANNIEVPNMVCPLFGVVSLNVSADTSKDKTISIGSSDANLRVRDSSYTDATTFKSAMSGVYLNYELATYTEQDVDPEDTQIMLNRALSTVLGRNVSVDNPQEALDILTKGE